MFVMLFATIGISIATSSVTSQTYDSLIKEGDNITNSSTELSQEDQSAAESKYIEAIEKVEPDNVKAYQQLMNLYLKDKKISTSEYQTLRKYINLNEGKLKEKDESLYINDFVAPFADNLSFSYERKGGSGTNQSGMDLAKTWYKKVKDSSAASESNKKKAETMYDICSNVYSIGKMTQTGETELSYKEYWDLLNRLVDENLFSDSNLLVQLHLYKMVANETVVNLQNWKVSGINQDEYLNLLNTVKSKTKDIESSEAYKINVLGADGDTLGLGDLVSDVYSNVDSAVAAGYGVTN